MTTLYEIHEVFEPPMQKYEIAAGSNPNQIACEPQPPRVLFKKPSEMCAAMHANFLCFDLTCAQHLSLTVIDLLTPVFITFFTVWFRVRIILGCDVTLVCVRLHVESNRMLLLALPRNMLAM